MTADALSNCLTESTISFINAIWQELELLLDGIITEIYAVASMEFTTVSSHIGVVGLVNAVFVGHIVILVLRVMNLGLYWGGLNV